MAASLHIVLGCADGITPKARYVLDTLLMAAGTPVDYSDSPPADGPFLLYGPNDPAEKERERCLWIWHSPSAWRLFDGYADVDGATWVRGLPLVLGHTSTRSHDAQTIQFDIVANAFYFLSSWSERQGRDGNGSRRLHRNSVTNRMGVPQDVVDLYLEYLIGALRDLWRRVDVQPPLQETRWPSNAAYAVVLSHDIDFIPAGRRDTVAQGLKSVMRHLVKHRDVADAAKSAVGLVKALWNGRDPYGCVPEIIQREKALGVSSSFQIAVGHRHRMDVKYRIEDDSVRDYLHVIAREGFDLCLHGSYRSTEHPAWYAEEVELLTRRLGRPKGSRQHFLSFDYDTLFRAQERSGIEYDMSMGFPDRLGPRAGFSFPYFPYCLDEDRPYNVLQVSLFLMDVTLRGYMRLKGERAWQAIEAQLECLWRKAGCASVVWHPIVFGGARDPGYDTLYWKLIEHVRSTGGLATDGRAINTFWRERAKGYPSFARGVTTWRAS